MNDVALTPSSWAWWVAQQAPALYLFTLLLLLGVSWAGGWMLQQNARSRPPAPPSSNGLLLQRLAVGGIAVLGAVAALLELADALRTGSPLTQFAQQLADALRVSLSSQSLQLFGVLTHLADTVTLTLLCLVLALILLVRQQRGLALFWVVALAGNGLLNQLLKQAYDRVRPLEPDGSVMAHGLSFPSGHSSGALVAYGMLCYLAWRLLPTRWHLPVLTTAVAVVFTVGTSRVLLRLHFVSDVLAGFASGLSWLVLCILCLEVSRWSRARGVAANAHSQDPALPRPARGEEG